MLVNIPYMDPMGNNIDDLHPVRVWKLGVWNYDTMMYWRRPKATGLHSFFHGRGGLTRYEGCSCGSLCCPNHGGSLVFLDLILCLHTLMWNADKCSILWHTGTSHGRHGNQHGFSKSNAREMTLRLKNKMDGQSMHQINPLLSLEILSWIYCHGRCRLLERLKVTIGNAMAAIWLKRRRELQTLGLHFNCQRVTCDLDPAWQLFRIHWSIFAQLLYIASSSCQLPFANGLEKNKGTWWKDRGRGAIWNG